MKLEQILSRLNSLEKNSFLKIVDNILGDKPKQFKVIEKIRDESSKDLKAEDDLNISRIFNLIQDEFTEYLSCEFVDPNSQLDIIADIITRDGRCMAKREWFAKLYEQELSSFEKRLKEFIRQLDSEKSSIDPSRIRDYQIYRACIVTAYKNDEERNQERRITPDEQSILLTLAKKLGLSKEEQKLINYSVLPIVKKDIDAIVNELKNIGILFYSRKCSTIYIPQEVVAILRRVRGKEIADKYFRRVLKHTREPVINVVCRKHNIDWRMPLDQKVELLINSGISFTDFLIDDIHKEGTSLNDKKKQFNELVEVSLGIKSGIKGIVMEEKVNNLVDYYNETELDEKVAISLDGYDKLVRELGETLTSVNGHIKGFFELQEENVLSSKLLLDYNIKPQDILEILPVDQMKIFIDARGIKTRGDLVQNILDSYRDSENIYMENYENIAYRDHNALKSNGVLIPEAELGVKFEELTKRIFTLLGFNVDEDTRKKLNTAKDKIDIVLSIGKNDIILIECKSVKESGYNKFSSVFRQLKAYRDLASGKNYNVVKSLLIAPEFTDEFINDCELEYELNLSLITAGSLIQILEGVKKSRMERLPYKLLLRDVLIQPERIIKAIK